MVYYIYELRWTSSDNTLKELDASGSFFIVIITIFKELYEYFRSELPLYVNGIYVLLCLILMLGILGTEKFDKYLNSGLYN